MRAYALQWMFAKTSLLISELFIGELQTKCSLNVMLMYGKNRTDKVNKGYTGAAAGVISIEAKVMERM